MEDGSRMNSTAGDRLIYNRVSQESAIAQPRVASAELRSSHSPRRAARGWLAALRLDPYKYRDAQTVRHFQSQAPVITAAPDFVSEERPTWGSSERRSGAALIARGWGGRRIEDAEIHLVKVYLRWWGSSVYCGVCVAIVGGASSSAASGPVNTPISNNKSKVRERSTSVPIMQMLCTTA